MSQTLSTSATTAVAAVHAPSRPVDYRVVEKTSPASTYTVVAHPPAKRT
jgi:hypothetical protein